MIEGNHLSKPCFYYEMFMERAYGSLVKQKPVMQASGMRNLIMAEKGRAISHESVDHFEEQLYELKKHIKGALISYMTMPGGSRELIDELKELKDEVAWAVSSEELMKIVYRTIYLTASLPIAKELITGFGSQN